MATPGAARRKGHPILKAGKSLSTGTIRVAKAITPMLASGVPDQVQNELAEVLPPGAPCSGRCGHCNHHPCRLHGGI